MKYGRGGPLLLTLTLCAEVWPGFVTAAPRPARGAVAAWVTASPAAPAPAQQRRGYGRRRRRGRVRRVLTAPYKAVKVSGKATGRAVRASGRAVGRTFRRAFGTRRRRY